MKSFVLLALALSSPLLFAQQSNRDAFLRQQAYAEMQRAMSQLETLQSNFDSLDRRISKLEHGGNTQALQAEIDSLRAAVAELRRELANQRGEIVKDLSGRIAKMQPKDPPPAPQPKPTKKKVDVGPTMTYEVQSGDSLYLIAMAFNTTVAKLRELNNLKKDNLRIGQKLIVPQTK